MNNVFHFKRFSVKHDKSAMKIGVDAVLIGTWVESNNPGNILDVGTGCGVISLILAQRFPHSNILGIDVDHDSVIEASDNFKISRWCERLNAIEGEFPHIQKKICRKFDLIVSNPPFFDAGIKQPGTPREIARHQGSLSIFSLLENSKEFLNPGGSMAIIFPVDLLAKIQTFAISLGWSIIRSCMVRDNHTRPFKRAMAQFIPGNISLDNEFKPEELTMFEGAEPTVEYRRLCKDFYLKF